MFDLVYSEILKLKKSKTLILIIISSMVFPVLWFLITPFNIQKQTWVTYTTETEDIMFMLIGIIAFVLLSSYIFLREYSDNTVKVLYSYPVSKISIFISKMLTIDIIVALIYLLHFITVFAGGRLVIPQSLTKEFFFMHISVYITSMIMQFSLIPLLIFIINIFKNTTASAMIAVFVLFSNFFVYEIGNYKYWPFILPYLPFMKLYRGVDIISAVTLAIGVFVIGIVLCIFQLLRVKDV